MADSAGVDQRTGRVLTDWAHVQQSIGVILTTPIGSVPMRRDFGSELPDMVDRKMTGRNVLALYAACAVAIDRWEPRFRLKRASVNSASAGGVLALSLFGTYFPRGHRGDYSVAQDASARVTLQSRT